ncbi:hypothetical protein [Streptomyces sp. NPDC018693]|uniref:hypothetical protein n=1 Tax=unclassified Streptomyces TaxID=2593676 RepID=UPI003793196A
METQKLQDYDLTELPAELSAVPGCAMCLSFVVTRQNARSSGDYSAVPDANVRMRLHHEEAHAS